MTTKDATLHFRIPADLRVELERIAAKEDRTLSQVAARALNEWLRTRKR